MKNFFRYNYGFVVGAIVGLLLPIPFGMLIGGLVGGIYDHKPEWLHAEGLKARVDTMFDSRGDNR